ncbi:MAG: ribosome silencing factor [Actinobacteria bacterium]|nr:ribosome silencing factor [Actinomycetota bacterium]MCB9388447.1 ribosome silencing factor [Acidimicrobiia bacterium]
MEVSNISYQTAPESIRTAIPDEVFADLPSDVVERAAVVAARTAEYRGGVNPVVLAMPSNTAMGEYFVIASASNQRLVGSLIRSIEDEVRRWSGYPPPNKEGLDDRQWALLDYGDFVVHVFDVDAREFYDLERLWGDAPRRAWKPQPTSSTDAAD